MGALRGGFIAVHRSVAMGAATTGRVRGVDRRALRRVWRGAGQRGKGLPLFVGQHEVVGEPGIVGRERGGAWRVRATAPGGLPVPALAALCALAGPALIALAPRLAAPLPESLDRWFDPGNRKLAALWALGALVVVVGFTRIAVFLTRRCSAPSRSPCSESRCGATFSSTICPTCSRAKRCGSSLDPRERSR